MKKPKKPTAPRKPQKPEETISESRSSNVPRVDPDSILTIEVFQLAAKELKCEIEDVKLVLDFNLSGGFWGEDSYIENDSYWWTQEPHVDLKFSKKMEAYKRKLKTYREKKKDYNKKMKVYKSLLAEWEKAEKAEKILRLKEELANLEGNA